MKFRIAQGSDPVIPNRTKDDRATIVSDAIDYINVSCRTVNELKILVKKKQIQCRRLSTKILMRAIWRAILKWTKREGDIGGRWFKRHQKPSFGTESCLSRCNYNTQGNLKEEVTKQLQSHQNLKSGDLEIWI